MEILTNSMRWSKEDLSSPNTRLQLLWQIRIYKKSMVNYKISWFKGRLFLKATRLIEGHTVVKESRIKVFWLLLKAYRTWATTALTWCAQIMSLMTSWETWLKSTLMSDPSSNLNLRRKTIFAMWTKMRQLKITILRSTYSVILISSWTSQTCLRVKTK